MSDNVIPAERIERASTSFADVETKRLKEQVRRNIERFPDDFMFVLADKELANWRSHFAASNSDRMGLRHAPMAFTEQGVAMLSSVVNANGRSLSTSRSCAPL